MAINTAELSDAQRGFLLVYLEVSAGLRKLGLDAESAARRAFEEAEREHPLSRDESAELSRVVSEHNKVAA